MNAREVYAPAVRKKIDAIERRIRKLDDEKQRLVRRIEELACGQSPIKPGDVIEWESGSRVRRGIVISAATHYLGFVYRCHLLDKNGRQVGVAFVDPGRLPVLVGRT